VSPSTPHRLRRYAHGERSRLAAGFTLLEVMVALAILAASLVAISEVVGGALRNHVRARQLDVATLLARGKMVELQAQYERKGFRDFDEAEDGTFEAEGHPEVRWKVEVHRPAVELGPDAVLAALTGGKTLQDLLPPPEAAPQLAPVQAMMTVTIQGLLTQIGEQLKKGVREVRLTVSWEGGAAPESFDVVTHLVVGEPEER
jgi:general secretion pathway protein I